MKAYLRRACDDIMRAAQLAACLEVSGTPKPGNVHRTFDYPDTRFEHFLAGGVALGPPTRAVALRGVRCGLREVAEPMVGIGRGVKAMVSEVKRWHRGGNTHLGTCLLFAPLAAGAGYVAAAHGRFEPGSLRQATVRLMERTTVEDSVYIYAAIAEAGGSALGKVSDTGAPDVRDESASRKLRQRRLTLWTAMWNASRWDNVAREWPTGMKTSFEIGYPTLLETMRETGDINVATVHAFLAILATEPDTFIARKVGLRKTENVEEAVKIGLTEASAISEEAQAILREGGLTSRRGREALARLDEKLRKSKGLLNPGSSADLTASSLFIALLCGLRF